MRAAWDLLRRTALQWNTHNAPRLGAALAYYTVLSIAPLLVVVVAIASLVFGQEAAKGQLVWEIQDTVGAEAAKSIQSILQSAHQPSTGVLATVLGVGTLLIGASAVFAELRDSLNLIWDVPAPPASGLWTIIKYRFFSFAMVLGIGFLLLVSLVLSAIIAGIGKYLSEFHAIPAPVLHAGNILLSFFVITLLFALIYKLIPDVPIQWRDVWIGAAATSILFTLGKTVIGLYLGRASIGSAYGAAGSLVILLVWVYYSAQIFFFGAEFTHVYAMRKGDVKSRPEQRFQNA
ncbi:MAG: YihY/virulence factor BrkB family protein [Acidobacteriota bacterium]|nr:YihY/virulence factor BrkB family protein [Acidobacteriota bacterium]